MSDNLLWAINIILLIWAGYLLHSLFWHGKVLGKPVRMKEVWSKQSLMEDMGNLADGFRSDLKRIVLEKGIPDLQVFESPIGLGGNEYLIFQRKLGLGLFTSMAVSMEPHGVDLAVDVRRMEISLLGTSSNVLRVFFGIAFIGAGLLVVISPLKTSSPLSFMTNLPLCLPTAKLSFTFFVLSTSLSTRIIICGCSLLPLA